MSTSSDRLPACDARAATRQLSLLYAFLVWLGGKVLLYAVPGLTVMIYPGAGAPPSAAKDVTILAATVPAHLLTLGVVWLYVTRAGAEPFWSTIGWDWGRVRGFAPAGWRAVALYAYLGLVALGLASFVSGAFADTGPTLLELAAQRSVSVRLMLALVSVGTAPLVEEAVYRGVLFPALRRSVGVVAAILLVSALFGAVHVGEYNLASGVPNWHVIAQVTVTGLCFTVVRAATGRLLPCVVMHATCNALVVLRFDLAPVVRQFLS
jgi:membrane protease YdiL (CAAX protease family)